MLDVAADSSIIILPRVAASSHKISLTSCIKKYYGKDVNRFKSDLLVALEKGVVADRKTASAIVAEGGRNLDNFVYNLHSWGTRLERSQDYQILQWAGLHARSKSRFTDLKI